MHYTIWIATPSAEYQHSRCFEEVAQSLQESFQILGHTAEITTLPKPQTPNIVILGAHLLHPDDFQHFPTPVIYQLEQMPTEGETERSSMALAETYRQNLLQAEVWDYSKRNLPILEKMGVKAKILPIGYSPCLTRIKPALQDIDVLHMGSMSDRRAKILRELTNHGVNVLHIFGKYGAEKDAFIARAKIVINIHCYDAKIFEIVRCSYLMANKKCVVSETGSDTELERPYNGAIAFTSYEYLVRDCLEYLKRPDMIEMGGNLGFDIFSKHRQSEFLKAVL